VSQFRFTIQKHTCLQVHDFFHSTSDFQGYSEEPPTRLLVAPVLLPIRQVGFGLGLSARAIDVSPKVTEHVILEANEMVMAKVLVAGHPRNSG